MAKAIVFVGVFLVVITSLTSCKRDFKCSCTTTTKINDSVTAISITKEDYRTTRNKAKGWCSDWSSTTVTGNDTTVTTNDCMFE